MAACAADHTCTQKQRGSRNVPHAETRIYVQCNKVKKKKGEVKAKKEMAAEGCEMETDELSNGTV